MRTLSYVVLAVLGLFFTACGSDDDHLGDWAKAPQFAGSGRIGAVSFVIDDIAYVGLGLGDKDVEMKDFWKFDYNNGGTWTRVADFPGRGRHAAVAFVANGKAYVGTGYIMASQSTTAGDKKSEYLADFYCYDPGKDSWSKIADFPIGEQQYGGYQGCRDAVAFSDPDHKYGYVGTGKGRTVGSDVDAIFKDFYKYDPATNKWTRLEGKSAFIGDKRYGASAFVVGGNAYVCLGTDNSYVRDVCKFDFTTETWEFMGALTDKPDIDQDKDYDRIPRAFAVSFVSNKGTDGQEYAYIATGIGGSRRTVWRYNHFRDQWHQVEDLSNMAADVVMGVGFSVNGYGFYTTGGSATDATGTTPSLYSNTWRLIPDVKEWRGNDY